MSETVVSEASVVIDGAKTVRKAKGRERTVTKNSLSSPFGCQWPTLPSGVTPEILAEIKRTFEPLVSVLAKKKSRNRKNTERRRKEKEEKKETDEEKKQKALRLQLALGINEVTRSLEKDRLRLLMVCRSAKPEILTSHLCALSATRQCPALALFHLSETLAPLLKMNTVLAVGFRKKSVQGGATEGAEVSDFDNLVALAVERCPKIHVPWLNFRDCTPDEVVHSLPLQRIKGPWLKPEDQQKLHGRRRLKKQVPNKEPPEDDRLSNSPEMPEQSKKRKHEDVAASLDENDGVRERKKVKKMPFGQTSIKQIKIISKTLKGKTKKKKGNKKK
ncbi:ribonuclease P protein subunit p38-like [Diadema setosum]|uniref:ribonuclease P protein subunit p38-like n=1 Tax=Diadema setosum TaxID=31175 RepID=UPI003B3BB516